MHDTIAIELTRISKFYKLYDSPRDRLKEALSISGRQYHHKFYATKNLSLRINRGEIIGIVGKNGSGKSTLLKLITGVLTPDQGEIHINGKISALLELGSGFNPEFTGRQNIFFYGTILGFSKNEMAEKLDDIIAFADIGEFLEQPIKTYSSGMKARLAFAVAVHVDPEILILDEVLSVGDIHFKRKSYAKMEEFFNSGKTILYVTHSIGEINRLCTRAIMLHKGNIIMDGIPKEVTKFYEKFLFAKDENKDRILQEIKDHAKLPTVTSEKKSTSIETTSSKSICSSSQTRQKAYFIPDLISENRIEYDDSKLEIVNIHLKTLSGEIVNVLTVGERYMYCYTLKFKANFSNVDFGMQIHSEKGVLITGCKNEESMDFQSGDKIEVCWEFDCLMHEGIYYTSTGVNHPVNGERVYINRIVDALVFKVLPTPYCCNGLIYLNQTSPHILVLT